MAVSYVFCYAKDLADVRDGFPMLSRNKLMSAAHHVALHNYLVGSPSILLRRSFARRRREVTVF
jgi:hypothetical protein